MQPVSREQRLASSIEENDLPTTIKLTKERKPRVRDHDDAIKTTLPVESLTTHHLPPIDSTPTEPSQNNKNPHDPATTAKLDKKKRIVPPVQPETVKTKPRLVDLSDKDLTSIKFAVTKNVPKGVLQAGMPIVKVHFTESEELTKSSESETSHTNGTKQALMPVQTATSTSQAYKQQTVTDTQTATRKAKQKRHQTRRVPEIRQMTAVECGAACIAMILAYHGRPIRITEVQEHCAVGRDGLSALSIVKAARTYGLRVRAVSVKKMDARHITLPAIIHWEFNHFVVLERWSAKRVEIVDPAIGRRRLTNEEFGESFTGVAILLEPGETFEKKGGPHTLSLMSYTRSLLQMRFTAIQIVLASLVVQVLGLGAPLLTAIVVDHILPSHTTNLFTLLGSGIILLVLSQAVMMFLRASLLIYLQTRIDVRMMLNFFEHLLSLPYRFFQIRLSGDLLSRLNSNVVIRDLFTNQLLTALLDVSAVIIYLFILVLQSPLIAGIAVAIGAIQVTLLLVSTPTLRRLTQRDLAAQGKTQGYLNEALAGIATLKAAGAEQRALERWTNLFFDEMNIAMRRDYLSSIVGSLLGILQIATPLLLLWVGAMQVTSNMLSVGTMLALNVLAVSFLTPLNSLALTGKDIQLVQAHFERLADVLEAEPEQNPQQVQHAPTLTGQVDVEDINFQYDPTLPPVLHDITLHIQPGQKVALVGKTGSGKSTLGKLLIGLIMPTQGTIRFNGIPLHELNYREVRNQCGIVLQDAFVFSGSVHENIALNNPEMDMAQVLYAAQAAALDMDIEAMPMKYETFVAEGGSVLSGGQRQRLALARALANHPAILLLDEATSSLDVVTEKIVEHNLRQLACTQLVIAHRLSTIKNADLIVVLDDGCIVEQGTHTELLQTNGYYAHLIQAQLENGEIKVA